MDGNSEREAFAEQLRRLCADAGLSLGELAGLAHAHRGYLGHVEHGERWPSRAVVKALDGALDAGGCCWKLGGQLTDSRKRHRWVTPRMTRR